MRRLTTLLLGLLILASACSESSGTPPTSALPSLRRPPPSPDGGPVRITGRVPKSNSRSFPLAVLAANALERFDACEDLLDYFTSNAADLVGPWGLFGIGYDYIALGDFEMAATTTALQAAGGDALYAARGRLAEPGIDYSTTNVQEAGVGEPDVIKTDGTRILAIARGALHYVDVSGDKPELLGSLTLEEGWGHEIFLSGDRAYVMATDNLWNGHTEPWVDSVIYPDSPITVLAEVDISDPTDMRMVRELKMDGSYLSARRIGDTARIVIRSLPTGLAFVTPEGSGLRAERQAEEKNREIIEQSAIVDWLPYYTLEDRSGMPTTITEGTLLPCDQVHRPKEFSGLGMISVVTIDLERGLEPRDPTGILAGGETVYASVDSLYVATNRWFDPMPLLETGRRRIKEEEITTEVHKFDISDPRETVYVASGEVRGYLLNQWAMSEHDGYLRVASTSGEAWWGAGSETESFLTVLEDRQGELVQVGQIGDLGRGEQIYAVRYVGDVGFVVTFRQIDPLYTIDLSDPEKPEVLGELKILGYSAYLHPVGDGLLLGIGQDATERGRTLGTQIALFDVSDLTDPTRLHKLTIGDGFSDVEYDHRAFLYWPSSGITMLPVQAWSWDERSQHEHWFAGAVAARVSRSGGIEKLGTVTHNDSGKSGDDWFEWEAQIRRSLVIGDAVFTMSEKGIKANALDDLSEVAWVPFT